MTTKESVTKKTERKKTRRNCIVSKVCVRIADITVALISCDPELKLRVGKETERFLVKGADPDVRVRADLSDLSREIEGEKVFDPGAHWQLYRRDGQYMFQFVSPALGVVPYKVAVFDPDFTYGEVYLHRSYFDPKPLVYPLGPPLDQLLIIGLLAKGRGIELHACGAVARDGAGYLFAGQSGAGKTTIARVLQRTEGVTILSDDRIILRKDGGRLWMYGTPWHGDAGFACPSRAPLATVYFLGHGQQNELIPQRPAEAVGRLFACSFPLFYDPQAVDFTLGFLEEVAKGVPCYKLSFVPDEAVVEFIQSLKGSD